MLRRSPKSLSSGFVGFIGCPAEGTVVVWYDELIPMDELTCTERPYML
jgi:hypothetical protein